VVSVPAPKHPLTTPFAWALITLDGADTALLHVIDALGPEGLSTGMRVVAEFVPEDERIGRIRTSGASCPRILIRARRSERHRHRDRRR